MTSTKDEAGPVGDGVDRWLRVTVSLLGDLTPGPAGASPSQVTQLEAHLGVMLDSTHRRLLLAQDGWQPGGRPAALAGAVRLASIDWLGRAPRTFSGPALEDITGAATAAELREAGVLPGSYLVVAVDNFFGASYLMPIRSGQAGPEVVTVAGWVEEDTFVGTIYPSMSDFLDDVAGQVEKNVERVLAREAKEAHARSVWHAEPALVIRGLPASDTVLASGVIDLMTQITGIPPHGDWRIATRRWDGSAQGFGNVMSEATRTLPDGTSELFLSASATLASGATWQVSLTRSWPSAAKDHVLVLLRSSDGAPQATPQSVTVLLARAVGLFSPTSITASSTAANRAATEAGVPQPTGYRVWLRGDQLGSAAPGVDAGDFTVSGLGNGVLVSGPDDWAPELIVSRAGALVAHLREDLPQTQVSPSAGQDRNRFTRWLRSRSR